MDAWAIGMAYCTVLLASPRSQRTRHVPLDVSLCLTATDTCLSLAGYDLLAHTAIPLPPFSTPSAPPLSTSNQTTDLSTANFTAIFDAASNEYKTLTKQDLETHPFAVAFENSNSPDSVIKIFRKQAQAFDKFRKGDDKLMAWLTPIVNILFTFSGTLGEGIGLVSIQSFNDISTRQHLLS